MVYPPPALREDLDFCSFNRVVTIYATLEALLGQPDACVHGPVFYALPRGRFRIALVDLRANVAKVVATKGYENVTTMGFAPGGFAPGAEV